ncbi:N-acetyltransferase [Oscillospiraceae bacterium OttesenSCG-928-G22]|nr:N-acetyltransferase [Oscillospiraceae bacterium OttesenSCG-928-G22]
MTTPIPVTLRLETPADYAEVERLTYAAFETLSLPGRTSVDEHFLAHKMRSVPGFVPALDYVALLDGRIVGNIMYTKSRVVDAAGGEHETLTFGPLSVLPERQGQGIGRVLVEKTVEEAGRMGHRAILIFGHPGYYHRFGFQNAGDFSITTPEGENFDAFMALPLYRGALDGISGKAYFDPVYEIDKDELAAFNRSFF